MIRIATLLVSLWTIVYGGQFHVQGIAYDSREDQFVVSFTTSLVKADAVGNVIASVDRIHGHIGAVTFDPETRKAYASLELKDDAIGSAISKGLGEKAYTKDNSAFYIAEIDIDRLDRMGMSQDEVITLYPVQDAIRDYREGRYSCSGVDGIAIVPKPGKLKGEKFLYVAYGIYGDPERTDNDYNIIVRYDLRNPGVPLEKYFIYTGSTNWGIQNMTYDPHSGKLLLAVYKGLKPQFPNFDLYSVDMSERPFRAVLPYPGYSREKIKCLKLSDDGITDPGTGISGWRFKWGSTGICALGDGLFYISENGKDERGQYSAIRLYVWTGDPASPFSGYTCEGSVTPKAGN